jgi:hypothetical protein
VTDDEERELKGRLLVADIANKEADTLLKIEQRRWDPWKAMSAAFGAGIAVASALIALSAWILAHFIQAARVP